MNVLHICSYYTSSKLYESLIKELDNKDIRNTVYVPGLKKRSTGPLNKHKKLLNSEIIYSQCFNYFDRLLFHKKVRKIYIDLLNKVKLENINIIHAHSLFINGYIAYKLKKEKHIEYIVAVRGTDLNIFFKNMPHLRKIGLEIMKEAKKIIFISYSCKEEILQKYVPSNLSYIEKKMLVIPNGVDNFWIENMYNKERTILENKKIKILYVGNLDKNKNVISSIKAIKILRQKGYDIQFDIIGKGNQFNKIKKISETGDKFINIYHYMAKDKLIEKYRQGDIFLMPSKYETFGLVYVEALTQGLPVIYTKGQGFDKYYKNGEVGYRVNCKNIIDISEKIELLMKLNLDIRSKYKDISQKFNWCVISDLYIDIYNK